MKVLTIILIVCCFLSCTKTPELLFVDHFDGTSLNEEHWNYELGDGCPNLCGWGNDERQLYTKENVSVTGGNLVIRATHIDSIYQSGRITTKDKIEFTYGSIEVRAKLPKGQGIWPAIWMLGANIDTNKWPACGEIDIMEYVGKEPHIIHTSLHTTASSGNTINTKKTINTRIEDGFHIYKTIWTEEAIQFQIDNKNHMTTYNP